MITDCFGTLLFIKSKTMASLKFHVDLETPY